MRIRNFVFALFILCFMCTGLFAQERNLPTGSENFKMPLIQIGVSAGMTNPFVGGDIRLVAPELLGMLYLGIDGGYRSSIFGFTLNQLGGDGVAIRADAGIVLSHEVTVGPVAVIDSNQQIGNIKYIQAHLVKAPYHTRHVLVGSYILRPSMSLQEDTSDPMYALGFHVLSEKARLVSFISVQYMFEYFYDFIEDGKDQRQATFFQLRVGPQVSIDFSQAGLYAEICTGAGYVRGFGIRFGIGAIQRFDVAKSLFDGEPMYFPVNIAVEFLF